MKKMITVFAAIAFLSGSLLLAQEKTSGEITYQIVEKLNFKLEGAAAELAKHMPKENKTNKVLLFKNQESLFKDPEVSEENDKVLELDGGNTVMVMRTSSPEHIVYNDLKGNKQIEKKEFMSRLFLIEDEIDTKGWKLTGKQKEVLGYTCQEAVKTVDEKEIRVYFTSEIPVASGPESYVGVPGMVLAAEVGEDDKIITATDITFREIEKDEMEKPKKGKKMDRKAYAQMVEEKMEEMKANQGGGTFIIRH